MKWRWVHWKWMYGTDAENAALESRDENSGLKMQERQSSHLSRLNRIVGIAQAVIGGFGRHQSEDNLKRFEFQRAIVLLKTLVLHNFYLLTAS